MTKERMYTINDINNMLEWATPCFYLDGVEFGIGTTTYQFDGLSNAGDRFHFLMRLWEERKCLAESFGQEHLEDLANAFCHERDFVIQRNCLDYARVSTVLAKLIAWLPELGQHNQENLINELHRKA